MQRASAFGACQLIAAGRPGQKWRGKAFDTLCLLFSAYEFGTCASVGRETCSRMRETRGEPWMRRNAARRKCESCKTKRDFLRFVFIVKSQHSNNVQQQQLQRHNVSPLQQKQFHTLLKQSIWPRPAKMWEFILSKTSRIGCWTRKWLNDQRSLPVVNP